MDLIKIAGGSTMTVLASHAFFYNLSVWTGAVMMGVVLGPALAHVQL